MGGDDAGGGGNNDTTTQVDSFTEFGETPGATPGFDSGAGPDLPSLGVDNNPTPSTGAGNGNITPDPNKVYGASGDDKLLGGAEDDLLGRPVDTLMGKPTDLTKPMNTTPARSAALAGKSALYGGLGLPGGNTLTDEEQARVDAQAKGLDKAEEEVGDTGGFRVTPATEGLLGLKSKGIGIKGGRPGVIGKTKIGYATMVGAAVPIPGAVAVGRGIDAKTNYALGSKTFTSFTPTDGKPGGNDFTGGDGDGNADLNVRLRNIMGKTPATNKSATTNQPATTAVNQVKALEEQTKTQIKNIVDKQERSARQRRRAASSETTSSGLAGTFAGRLLTGVA
jgi:hypothetical protein